MSPRFVVLGGAVLVAVVGTAPEVDGGRLGALKPWACPTAANGHNLFAKGVEPYATRSLGIPECCAACTADASCGAWFGKVIQGQQTSDGQVGTPSATCKLYSHHAAGSLDQGGCPQPPSGQAECGSAIFSPPSPPPSPPPAHVSATVESVPAWTISRWLATMSLVYCWAPDAAGYANGSIASWAKATKMTTARFPAGTASYWNWENPSGYMGQSTLSKSWVGPAAPKEDWMSLEEYLELCKAADLTPLIGVNYNCHNYQMCSETSEDSIARAVRQVKYVVSQGFPGAFWYIGNEDGAPQHATLIAEHCRAIKAVDPTLKCGWNDNNLNPDSLTAFLKTTGNLMDFAEFHGKWPYGGTPGLPSWTLEQYLNEVPLVDHKARLTWRDKIAVLRTAAAEAGRPNLMLANNEYGLGKESAFASSPQGNFTRFTKSLVMVEFLLEMYVGGYDMAVYWDNGDGGTPPNSTSPASGTSISDHMLLDSGASYRMNPMHIGFEMLATAQNKSMLRVNTSAFRVHGFAAWDQTSLALELFLINKYQTAMNVSVALPKVAGAPVPSLTTVASLVDTEDHWGTQVQGAVACANAVCALELPALSFSRVYASP